jgi:hypothetical protein
MYYLERVSMLKRSFKLNFILLILVSFNILSVFAENNQDNIPFPHLAIKIPSQYPVRVLGAGITDKLTHETLQFTCTLSDLRGEMNEHYFLNVFSSCDRLGMIATDVAGNKTLYPFYIRMPQNENLARWFKNEKENLFPYLAHAQQNIRRKDRTNLVYAISAIGGGAFLTAGVAADKIKDKSLKEKVTAGIASATFSTVGALSVAAVIHLAFDSKTYISTSFSKEDFLNKSKESWQYNPRKTRYYNLIKDNLLKSVSAPLDYNY